MSKDYLAQYKQRVQPTTYQLGELAINLFVKNMGEKTLIKNITLNRLNRYFNDVLYKHNNTNNTVRVYRGKVKSMFNYAVTYGYLKENLVTQVTINWKNEANRIRNRIENKYLTYEEYIKIINMFYDRHMDHYADIFKLQYLTGLRFGEAAGLQVKDVIHEGKRTYLDINHTLEFSHPPPVIIFPPRLRLLLAYEKLFFLRKQRKLLIAIVKEKQTTRCCLLITLALLVLVNNGRLILIVLICR